MDELPECVRGFLDQRVAQLIHRPIRRLGPDPETPRRRSAVGRDVAERSREHDDVVGRVHVSELPSRLHARDHLVLDDGVEAKGRPQRVCQRGISHHGSNLAEGRIDFVQLVHNGVCE